MTNPSQRSTLVSLICLAIICFSLWASWTDARLMQSADLYATWLAGEFLSMGQPDQVYPANTDVFDMTPPSGWWPHVEQTAPDARLFPYIYPPIWAELVSLLNPYMGFAVFDLIGLVLNQMFVLGATFLALRMCGLRGLPLLIGVALTYTGLVLTMPIGIALGENQPQILVSFLIVAAFERAYSRSPKLAGALLALAASIKVYPLLFIVIFAARRQWQAVLWFIGVGGALALLSIGLAGWPLHDEYLRLLSVVSRSVVLTNFSFSFDAIIAKTFFADAMISVYQPSQLSDSFGWSVVAKTPVWVMMSGVAQIMGIAGVAFLAARRPDDSLVLPFAASLFALLSPLSWAYTYMTAFVFLGALVFRLGRWGMAISAAMFMAFSPAIAKTTLDLDWFGAWSFWLLGVGLMIAMTIALLTAILRSPTSTATHKNP